MLSGFLARLLCGWVVGVVMMLSGSIVGVVGGRNGFDVWCS